MGFLFVGNALWLDFLNTETAAPAGGGLRDSLGSPADLGAWAAQAGIECAIGGEAWLGEARDYRARLRTAAEHLLGKGDPIALVTEVNTQLAARPSIWRLALDGEAGRLNLQPAQSDPDPLLHHIALDCARTLAAGRQMTLKACEREGCVVLFLDTSKNRGRRWCRMDVCGNREKAAARRLRERDAAEDPAKPGHPGFE